MSGRSDPRRDQALGDLWQRRNELDQGQWKALWTLVWECLGRTHYPEYGGLDGMSAEELVARFFQDKAFLPSQRAGFLGRPVHCGALVGFYRNYLRDRLDGRRRRLPEDQGLRLDAAGGGENQDGALAAPAVVSEEDCLREAGLSPAAVAEAARRFLYEQEPWVGLYLGLHYCPDKEDSLALFRLAERYQIPSYHYRARELGITAPKGGLKSYEDYGRTRLGRWLASLGIEVRAETRPEMLAAFKILCLEALQWMNDY